MKKLSSFLLAAGFLLVCSLSATAQTKFNNRNNDERIAQRVVTTDSTLTYIDSLKLNTNECGIIEVTVIGYAKDTAYGVTGVIRARYNKRRGTLTLGTITEIEPITRDAVLANTAAGGATFTLVAVNNNVYVRVKGRIGSGPTPYTITWTSFIKSKSIQTVL